MKDSIMDKIFKKKELECTYDEIHEFGKKINIINKDLDLFHERLLFFIDEMINNSSNMKEALKNNELYEYIKSYSNIFSGFLASQTEDYLNCCCDIDEKIILLNKEIKTELMNNDISKTGEVYENV